MSATNNVSGSEGMARVQELINDIRIAILVTAAADGTFDSRPMATQQTQFDGSVWFLTRKESGKVEEIKHDSHVTLMYADPSHSKYISMKGRAEVSHQRNKIHELWNPMYKAWFPGGEDDPSIAVLQVKVAEAHYWEASSNKLVYAMNYLAAAVTGGKVDLGESGTIRVG